LRLPLKAPMKMAGITIRRAENLLVRVESTSGHVGWGEAPSAPTMTGDTLGGLVAAVRDHLAPLLIGKDADRDHGAELRRSLVGNTGAHSALEMALLDLAGRVSGRRLIDIVARPARRAVAADVAARQRDARAGHRGGARQATARVRFLQAEDRRETARRRDRGRPRDPQGAARRDAVRRRELRAHRLRRAALRRTHARRRLAFIEQPLAADDLAGLKALARATRTPIGMDESIQSLADIEAVRRAGAKGVSLKLIKLGGFAQADCGRQALPQARPEDQCRGQDRRVEHRARRRRCISPARCRTSTGA
jgi:muconate cycloisomerase